MILSCFSDVVQSYIYHNLSLSERTRNRGEAIKNFTTMAQGIKKLVAHEMKQGNDVKNIINKVKNDEECNWLDVVSTFLWWLWFKTISPCFKWAGIILGILLWVTGVSIIAAVVAACIMAVMVITSPVWMPFRLWKTPEKVAKFLLNTQFEELNDPKETPFVVGGNAWKIGVRVMNIVWRPIYKRLPMSRRQFFIKEDTKALSSYESVTQLAYYDEQVVADKVATLTKMSEEAMRLVWNRGQFCDRENVLNAWEMGFNDFKLLFENEDKGMFCLLKCYCANEKNAVDDTLQCYFVEQLVGEHSDRAYEVLKVCALTKKRVLEVKTLTDLISMLGGEHGKEACDILTTYWERCTLSSEVVEELIKEATDSIVDDGKRCAYELLKKAVKRDGLTTELAELFFSRCNSAENAEMTNLLHDRMDITLIDWECVCATDKEQVKKLTDYFSISEDVSVDGQKLLREWQYELYRKTGHKLADEVISYLLVTRLKKSDISFFMQVLDEAGEKLSVADVKLMALTPWKRDILIERLAKDKSKKAIGTVLTV